MATEVGVGYVRLVPTARGFGAAADRAIRGPLDDVSRRAGESAGRTLTDRMSSSMQSAGRSMTAGLTVPLGGLGATAIKMSGDFEAAMNGVRAVTGASGQDFAALQQQAKDLGSTTQFSASEAANAMEFLGMAGWDTREIMEGLPDVLNLAAAGGIDLARAADVASNIMSGFGIEASEMGRVADVLAKTAASANVDINMLGESMKYAAPLASAAGWSLEETAAAVGVLGDAGMQGSMAGTGLNSILATLADTSSTGGEKLKEFGVAAKDADGEVRPLTDVMADLAEEGADVADVIGIFGLEAGPKMQALLGRGSEGLKELIADLESSEGAAQEMADIRMEGFNGSVKALQSAFEGLMIAIGESGLLEFATDLVTKITGLTQSLSESNPEMLKMGTIAAAVVAAIGPLLIVVGKIISVTAASVRAIISFGKALGTAGKAVGRAAGAVLRFTGRLASLIVRFTLAAARIAAQAARMALRVVVAFAKMTAAALRVAVQMAVTAARVVASWVLMGIQAMIQAARMAAAWVIAMGPVGWITAAVIALVALIIANWETISEWTSKIWGAVWGFIKDIAEKIWNFFLDWTIVGRIIQHWDEIKAKTEEIWNGIVEWVSELPGRLTSGLASLGSKLWTTARDAFQDFWDAASARVRSIIEWVGRIPGRITSALSTLGTKLWRAGKDGFQDFWDAASERIRKMVLWVTRIPGRIVRGIGNVSYLLWQKGRDIVSGLWSGIQSMGSWLKSKISGFVSDNIPGPVKSVLGIFSPSRVMRDEVGRMIPAGVVEGITAGEGQVEQAMRHLVSAPHMPRLPAMAGAMAGGGGAMAAPPQLVLAPNGSAAAKALMKLFQESLRNDYRGDVTNLNSSRR